MSFDGGDRRQAEAARAARADGPNLSARIIPLRQLHEASSAPGEPAPSPAAPAGAPAEMKQAESEVRGEGKARPLPGPTITIEQPIPAAVPSDGGGGNGGGAKSGGGGGGGGPPPLHKRSSDGEFRDVLGKGLANARRNLVTVGVFSVAVNLLVLAIPIYLFNMSDRVLTSRSTDTLVMLTMIVVIAIAAHVLMDMMRRIILMRVAVETEARLGGPVLSAAAKAAQGGSSREFQTLADLQHLRSFITGPVLLTMFDTPVTPVYFAVVFLIHPHLGFIVLSSGVALVAVALLNQRVTAVSFTRANNYGARANLQAESMARNAQVINAMGMIPEGVQVWGRETVESLKAQVIGQDRNIMMTGLSKFLRLSTQIGILGWGAWLALENQMTSGMVIAASIVASRALAPLEGTIEGWRSFVQARSAYARVKNLLLNSPLNMERLRLPRPAGYLNVERILYVPPPNKKVILNGISDVIYLSADTLADEKKSQQVGPTDIYIVRVKLNAAETNILPNFTPTPGMPAEVYIKTSERTFFQYIVKPIHDSVSRAFRER